MGQPGYPDALGVLRQAAGGDLHRVLAAACAPVPAWDPVIYLADFAHQVLFPLAAGVAEEQVATTMAGRAFATGQPVYQPAGRLGPGVGAGGGTDDPDRGAGDHRPRRQ